MRRISHKNTREQVESEREYGVFWYSWLWTVLRPVLIGVCVALVVIGVVMSAVNRVRSEYFDAVDRKDSTPVSFTVASGTSLTGVARQLEEAGLVHNGTVVKYYADLLGYGQKIQAGDYVLTRAMTMPEIVETLTTGDGNPLTRRITVIPGQTVEEIAAKLFTKDEERTAFISLCRTGEEFREYYYIADAMKANNAGYRPYMLEGYLAADTYEVYTSAGPEAIIRKLLSQTQAVFPEEYQARADQLGLTMDQVFILASMIEKEAKTADFEKVSAVFHNRLDTAAARMFHGRLPEANGTLGSDATVKYATGITRMSLTQADLDVNTPYNTYKFSGLPAGPICSPSPDAIRAALYPDEDYLREGMLYFCSKEPSSGELVFARTYDEHQWNVAVYSPLWESYDREHEKK